MTTQAQSKWVEVPEELKRERRWVCWAYEERNGKRTKVPFIAGRLFRKDGEPRRASSRDPRTWRTYADAVANAGRFEGIGFMLGDGFSGIDLDRSLSADRSLQPWAERILDALRSYTEVSPSQRGLKLICYAGKPADAGPEDSGNRRPVAGGEVECYWERRFFTITGERWDASPVEIADCEDAFADVWRQYAKPAGPDNRHESPRGVADLPDAELIAKARAAKNGAQFAALFDRGDTTAYRRANEDGTVNDGESEADLALCSHLAFWTDRDAQRVDRLFRQSALMRPKWDRADYREQTVRKAVQSVTETLPPREHEARRRAGRRRGTEDSGGAGELVTVPRLAAAISDKDRFAVDDGLAIYHFDRGHYRPRGERLIRVV
ncbi:MAG: hypothetical protein NTW28_24645 [Candidatus Solibacter sp.]|nr:hypothetical protein [Candidatus Solibacter sp.]